MKHGAKGKASIPKDGDEDMDKDEDTDEDDIEETFERLNQHKPGKQVGTKQCKVDGKKSDKGKGAEGKGTKGKGTKHQSTKVKLGLQHIVQFTINKVCHVYKPGSMFLA